MLYTLADYYSAYDDPVTQFVTDLKSRVNTALTMGKNATQLSELITFVGSVIYGYFYADPVAYKIDSDEIPEDFSVFLSRISYDINLHIPYWFKKYEYIKKLLTTSDFDLLQTSKMTSSSSDRTKSAGGSLQKIATTPTGVSADSSTDEIDITIGEDTDEGENTIDTTGFVDKYTNTQQKYANASDIKGERSGEIMREGSIKELLEVIEKLPATFGNDISIVLQKHFIFDYDGLERGIYETN